MIGDAGQQDLEQLSIEIEPPKLTAEELTECYAWADVVLIVSRWEGLPLTILEAMRLGVVVCATAVGAVAEAITHNETGFLLPGSGASAIARAAVEILQTLCDDRAPPAAHLVSCGRRRPKPGHGKTPPEDFLEQLDRLTAALRRLATGNR